MRKDENIRQLREELAKAQITISILQKDIVDKDDTIRDLTEDLRRSQANNQRMMSCIKTLKKT